MLLHDTSQNIEQCHSPYDGKSLNRPLQIGTTFRILNIALFVFDQEPRVLKRLARVHDFAAWLIPGLALRNLTGDLVYE